MDLLGTLYSFTDLKTNSDRTRIIVFATDNDLAGTELITLEDACTLCKKYKVNLYAYCPTVEMNIYTSKEKISNYKKAVEENAEGKFYTGDLDEMSSNIVNEIKNTKTSLLESSKKKYIVDHPEILVIFLVILFGAEVLLEKKLKIL